jgi:hypothetical protein
MQFDLLNKGHPLKTRLQSINYFLQLVSDFCCYFPASTALSTACIDAGSTVELHLTFNFSLEQ